MPVVMAETPLRLCHGAELACSALGQVSLLLDNDPDAIDLAVRKRDDRIEREHEEALTASGGHLAMRTAALCHCGADRRPGDT